MNFDDIGTLFSTFLLEGPPPLILFNLVIFHLRPIKGICGLTAEVIIGLVANLESRELRRVEYCERGFPFEHPRASATDDVEGIIATMHEMIGDAFDLKQFIDE